MPVLSEVERVVVTGGSGVVGSAVIRHLTSNGVRPTALSRSESSDMVLEGLGATPVRGDILTGSSLDAAFDGAEVVFHVAGVNEMCTRDPGPMYRANIDGSVAVVEACKRAGVGRLVYTSSAAALGEAPGTVGSEASVHRGAYVSHYERSKHLAEVAVREASDDLDVVIVNPSSVQGPGRASGTGKLILDVLNGSLPVLVDTDLSIVDIDDCARGHVLAAERGIPGRRYILNSFSMTVREAVDLLATDAGIAVAPRFIPGRLAAVGAAGVEIVSKALRRHTPVCREMVETMLQGHVYDGSRAQTELGLDYTAPGEFATKLIDWFRAEGLLRR